ncbi:hypothetical protein [Enterobacter asburiae]|uniref:hypothetical protein n=1 Tax=Enterobacter asburiae TaxID=61645 RepID=UPI000FD7E938|nr:hypothetical protein [Enterobacter asburiae]HDN2547267.1 hypothetical protein [Enterobacter asburiae]HDN2552643.1 hypothetical protein [Enterobacter asburiae]
MTDLQNNKEMIAVGHEFARTLSSDTPIIEIAKMITLLAGSLDCVTLALREMTKQRDSADQAERVWERTMMDACGEDGPKSVADKFAALEQKLAVSQREFRAADATIENLQMQVEKLAAENAGLKELIEQHANSVAVCPNCSHEEPSETDDIVALYRSMETPATGAFLAEVRASAITDALKSLDVVFDTDCVMESNGISYEDAEQRTAGAYEVSKALEEFAAQLRKGVQS